MTRYYLHRANFGGDVVYVERDAQNHYFVVTSTGKRSRYTYWLLDSAERFTASGDWIEVSEYEAKGLVMMPGQPRRPIYAEVRPLPL